MSIQLIQEINQAFPSKVILKKDVCEFVDWETELISTDFGNKTWKEIDDGLIKKDPFVLSFFTPIACCQFIPAYMVHSLNDINLSSFDGVDDVTISFIYFLTPSKKSLDLHKRWTDWVNLLTNQQRQVVVSFLELILNDERMYNYHKEVEKSLNFFWYTQP